MGAQQDEGKPPKTLRSPEKDDSDESDLKLRKYLRGDGVNLEGLKDKKLKVQLAVREDIFKKSAKAAAKSDQWLLPSEGGYLEAEGLEKTYGIKQIVRGVDILSSRKAFDLVLPALGPYTLAYTLSGRYLAFAGRKGHLAIIDTLTLDLYKEFQVGETVRDVVFLHNELFFAAAQKKYPYIYSRDGTELHCLKEHGAVQKLQFLEAVFLLASVNRFGELHYQDVTEGKMVGNYRTGLGRCDVMQVNPYNIVGLGHSCGLVTMWTPTSPAPPVKMLCHEGPVTAMAFHPGGHLMATAGMEKKIKLWDLRKYEILHTYPGHASTLQFSQKGLLAIGSGSRVQVWRDSLLNQDYSRYMSHSMVKSYKVDKVMFQPYEDVLGIGHSIGISNVLVPGAGEPNFTWWPNPMESAKQRREREVQELLAKHHPETVILDPSKIGCVRPYRKKEQTKQEREAEKEAAIVAAKNAPLKKKTKGWNKPSVREKKKKKGIVSAKQPYMDQQLKEEHQTKKKQRLNEEIQQPKALQLFIRMEAL